MHRKEQSCLVAMNTMKIIDNINIPVPLSPGADTVTDSVKEPYNMLSGLFFVVFIFFCPFQQQECYCFIFTIHHSSIYFFN